MDNQELLDALLRVDEALAQGTGDLYRRLLTEDAVVALPGMGLLDREACAAALDASDATGWDSIAMHDARLVALGRDAAAVTYRFEGRRGDFRYAALMTSAYVRREGEWSLAVHQQTPL
ncbi:MAG TPA: nuclear transport factor 2 family protein [Solirubrobacterales bacterium]|jgi:hypothetical protein